MSFKNSKCVQLCIPKIRNWKRFKLMHLLIIGLCIREKICQQMHTFKLLHISDLRNTQIYTFNY